MSTQLLYQIALTLVPNIGCIQARALTEKFGDAQQVFKARKRELSLIEQIGDVRAASLKNFSGFGEAEAELAFIEKYKIQALFITHPAYPKRLLPCHDAPAMLYYHGNADLNSQRVVSIIGTRNHTDYGKQITEKLVQDLQQHHVLITSGLAFGVDAIAHKAALQNGLPTVAVLAHGLDTLYPSQHRGMAKEMLDKGGLLTEMRRNSKPDKHNFPRRNRIVAGMADATIVIETAVRGGSMITAALANGYKPDVFAYPGRATDNKSAGCNLLIQNNRATLITNAEDILEKMRWASEKKPSVARQKELFVTLTEEEKILVQILQTGETLHIDDLHNRARLTGSSAASAILNLELQGIIISLPGNRYRLT